MTQPELQKTRVQEVVERQRDYFLSGATLDISTRRKALEDLRGSFIKNESLIEQAAFADMRRAPLETFLMDMGMVIGLIDYTLPNLENWTAPKPVPEFPGQPGAEGKIYPEPYGVALIQSAWNYPIMQLFAPLVGALAAGNTAVLRPASTSPNCARAAATIAEEAFGPELVACEVGPSTITSEAIAAPVDYVFFTGSPKVGKTIMELAARQLIPVTLELGGKCPAIVDRTADIQLAARRIAWAKLSNAGQICLTVDHVYVHRDVADAFVQAIVGEIEAMVGQNPIQSDDLARIINDRNFERIQESLKNSSIAYGGDADPTDRYVGPTILTNVSESDPIMQEEIFGPVLPVLQFDDLNSLISLQQRKPKPLGMYVFAGDDAVTDKLIRETSAGGVSVNETMLHSASPYLPYGGVGNSGMGQYQGKYTFDTFTHYKSVLDGTKHQMEWRYMPYTGKLEALKAQAGWNHE